jgi:hypothetical protein
MKYSRFVILFALFIGMVVLVNRYEKEELRKSNVLLTNNVEFEGHITGFDRSGNHDFGVIRIKVMKSNVQEFNRSQQDTFFPYRIKGNLAEIYCIADYTSNNGDSIRVVSNEQTIYFNPQNSKEQGDLYLISEPLNLRYIQKHTVFK